MKKIYTSLIVCSCLITGIYAANTLIFNVRGSQIATLPSSYPTQSIQTIQDGNLRFMNFNEDSDRLGDYFSGYYYDSMYGVFQTDAVFGDRVRISAPVSGRCINSTTHTGYKLTGFSYNSEFGFVDFDFDATRFVYVCIANTSGQLGNTTSSYIGGYAYSPEIGFQNFDGIQLEGSVITGSGSMTLSARQIKILGLTSSKNTAEVNAGQFLQDVRLVGQSSKTELRKKIQQNVSSSIRGISTYATTGTISNLSGLSGWQAGTSGTSILGGEGRYFAPSSGGNISLSGVNLEGNKTMVVEGGNIYITGNIRGSGILALIALEKNGVGGNIYISPSVTDIHAVIYADRSVISYNGTELDGATADNVLANQLYIKGSLFSENTLGGFELSKCPFYVKNSDCTSAQQAAKYDLNYLRRYILVQEFDVDGLPVGSKKPQFDAKQSYAGGTSEGSRNTDFQDYAVVIEYDSRVQQNTPKLFK